MSVLLVLRPEPGCTATASRARAAGWDVIAAPMFAVRPVAWSPPTGHDHDALLLTSANAIRHAGGELGRLKSLPVYAVGEATAMAARVAGFRIAGVGHQGADALLRLAAAGGAWRLLHLAGEDHRAAEHPSVSIDRCIVYRAEAVARLPGAIVEALDRQPIALVHSPRAGAVFARLVDACGGGRSGIRIAAISPAAADAAGAGWRRVAAATRPDDESLLAAARMLCEEAGR